MSNRASPFLAPTSRGLQTSSSRPSHITHPSFPRTLHSESQYPMISPLLPQIQIPFLSTPPKHNSTPFQTKLHVRYILMTTHGRKPEERGGWNYPPKECQKASSTPTLTPTPTLPGEVETWLWGMIREREGGGVGLGISWVLKSGMKWRWR